MKVASRAANVKTYFFATKLKELRAREQQGSAIINLGIGSPDLRPPSEVIEAIQHDLSQAQSFMYKPYAGIPELRKTMSRWYKSVYQVELTPGEIIPLIGSKEGIGFISLAYLESGDEVLVPDPGYPAYASAARLAGANVVSYDLKPELQWLPDIEQLDKLVNPNTRVIWINYPNMPTGAKPDSTALTELVAWADGHDILVCHDNPYSFLTKGQPYSLLRTAKNDNILELNSLSKSYNMAGARIGMLAGKQELLDPVFRVQSNFSSGMFGPIQHAAISAMELNFNAWQSKISEEYSRRRVACEDLMKALDCNVAVDQSGMFVWARIPDSQESGIDFSEEILDNTDVFITPGSVFGKNGNRYLRASLCNTINTITEATERINQYLNSRS